MTFTKEGNATLLVVSAVLIIINTLLFLLIDNVIVLSIAAIVSLILFLFFLQFFRMPIRELVIDENKIYAPADGEIVVIEKTNETEYFNDERIQVSIFMSPFNVHANWFPISGIVKYFKYHPGLFLVAWHPKSSTDNERTSVVIENEKGQAILVRQIAGAVARRIVWYTDTNEKAKQGEQFGFIKFGSRVDLFLPLDAKINVELKQKTRAKQTVIASFD